MKARKTGPKTTRRISTILVASLAVAWVLPRSVVAQVVINEILASNHRTNVDEDGDSSDWIELLNLGPAPVELEGYSLTDDSDDLRKWVFPAVTIPPMGYLLVWCSAKDRASGLVPEVPELVAHWPLARGEGAVFENLADPTYDGFLPAGASVVWEAVSEDETGNRPAQDFAALFSGAGSWIETGYPGIGGNDPRTIACWIRTSQPGGNDILGWGPPTNRLKWHFRVNTGAGDGVLGAIRTEYQGGRNVGTTPVDDGLWHHVVASFPEGARTGADIDHYVDGNLEGKTGGDLAIATDTSDPLYRLTIGLTRQGVDSNRYFHGLIADVRIYDQGLEAAGVRAVMEGGEPPPRLAPLSLHSNFKLEAGGEWVILADAAGEVVDLLRYPEQVPDLSYARAPDGTGDFEYHVGPTPLAENSGPSSPEPLIVADTKFDPNRGFYDAPLEVTISSATEGAAIMYTLDGSEPSEEHGILYSGPVPVVDTTTLRAMAFKEGFKSTDVDTHTYIFLETPEGGGIIHQPRLPEGFPASWGPNGGPPDYEMDPAVATDTTSAYYNPRVREGLLALPSMSLVMNVDDLFDPATGIYANPQERGFDWERSCSIEFIYPDGSSEDHQESAGIRIQGNASRRPDRPKHNFRLLFKTIYGAGKLRHQVFEDTRVDEFDTLILRGGNGDSWFHPSSAQQLKAQYIRDQWHRDVQLAMGRLTAHQRYMHLYINGLYWGLYHVFERPTGTFLASHLGGEREDYDAHNSLDPLDGDLEAWDAMMSIADGGVGSAAAYAAIQEYLDVPNLIDFLLINYHSGNVDWDTKNWYAGRLRAPGAGYMFFTWDAERTFWTLGEDRVGLDIAGRPTHLHQRLTANPEYRLLFADHVHRHFFDDGVLTPERAAALWQARADEIEAPLAAESARMGDNKRSVPYRVEVEWRAELDQLMRDYFPRRTGIVLGQIQARGLYPGVEAPAFNRHGGHVSPDFELTMSAAAGDIYYTMDGSDPRLPGGTLSPEAVLYTPGGQNRASLVAAGSTARILVPEDGSLGLDWIGIDFDDTSWPEGSSAVGYERSSGYEGIFETDLEAEMYGVTSSVYLRHEFDVVDPGEFESLDLEVKYDDGFVAYLNGVPVAEGNVPPDPSWDSSASGNRPDAEASIFERIDLSGDLSLLRAGKNVLAVHALNAAAVSADMLLVTRLTARVPDEGGGIGGIRLGGTTRVRARALLGGEWSAMTEAVFVRSALRVTEVMYRPAPAVGEDAPDQDEFEFIELMNRGHHTIDLAGTRLMGGIEFDFSTGEVLELLPGELVVVVEDRDAFTSRYGEAGIRIAGEYRGKLANHGERIRLVGPLDETLADFRYETDWHPVTDGAGPSLVVVDPSEDPTSLGSAARWRASDLPLGSPGVDETGGLTGGLQRPGDTNQDGNLDLSDAVRLLLILFRGDPTSPCGGEIFSDANVALLDANGDDGVNLTDAVHVLLHLFRGGPEHVLGVRCVRIDGCPDVCVP